MVNEKKKRVANIQLQKLKDETEMLKRSREEFVYFIMIILKQ